MKMSKHRRFFQKVSYETLLALVIESYSYSDIIRKAGYEVKGYTTGLVKEAIKRHGISIEHFTTQAEQAVRDLSNEIPYHLVLVVNSPYPTARARHAFKKLGIVPYRCAECLGEPVWRGKELVLVFDHIDGDSRNHKPSNLRWLCPNCNSQTDTFCGRNKKNPKRRKHSERNFRH